MFAIPAKLAEGLPRFATDVRWLQGEELASKLIEESYNKSANDLRYHVLTKTVALRQLTFKKPSSNRRAGFYICMWPSCSYSHQTVHNFLDHLRTHTGCQPFHCPFERINDGCASPFSQSSNRQKHLAEHWRRLVQQGYDSEILDGLETELKVSALH